jgi:hypothetical protein
MNKLLRRSGLAAIVILALFGLGIKAHAAFDQNLVIDDTVFDNTSSMTAAQIDTWLNTNFPNSCISTNNGFSSPDPTGYSPSTGFTYGANVSAGQVVYDAAQAYGLNPQVILATLEKESSVVTGDASYHCQYINTAMGYDCPDSGNCPQHPATESGFSKQVIHAAWFLKFGQQRSLGNTSWDVQISNFPEPGDHWDNSDDPQSCYSGPMTQGTFSTCPNSTPVSYDGLTTIDGTSVQMDSGATAALYWYTPHFHGNQLFYNNFTAWFGGTISSAYYSCHDASNVAGVGSGEELIRNRVDTTNADKLSLVILNNTGSDCVEVHTWLDNNYQTWIQHTATNLPAVNPNDSNVISLINNSGTSSLYLVDYNNTGSGMVELHGWSPSDQQWTSHTATNLPEVNPANAEVIAADPNGTGADQLYYVEYDGTASGMVEIHGWSPNLQQWTSHIATNLPAIDPTQGKIIAADLLGNGKDEFVYVKYANTQSGMVEVHVWSPGEQQWIAHIATNLPTSAYNPADDDVIAADRANNGTDQLLFVEYSGTTSGMVEVHGWTPSLQNWSSHTATSQPGF